VGTTPLSFELLPIGLVVSPEVVFLCSFVPIFSSRGFDCFHMGIIILQLVYTDLCETLEKFSCPDPFRKKMEEWWQSAQDELTKNGNGLQHSYGVTCLGFEAMRARDEAEDKRLARDERKTAENGRKIQQLVDGFIDTFCFYNLLLTLENGTSRASRSSLVSKS
jgi:hypothetical protein